MYVWIVADSIAIRRHIVTIIIIIIQYHLLTNGYSVRATYEQTASQQFSWTSFETVLFMYGMARISISLYRRMPKIRGKYFECFAHKQISHCGYLYVVHCSHTAYYMHFIQVSSKSQKPKVLLSQMFTANNNNKHVIMNEGECVLCDQLKSPINIIMIKTIPNE